MSGYGGNKGRLYTRTLRINSSNRVDFYGQTDTDFTVNLGNSLQKVTKLSVVHIQCPNIFYNVFQTTKKFNNYFRMLKIESAVPATFLIRITPGYYTLNELMTEISDSVTAAEPDITLTWSYDSITQRVSVHPTFAGTVTYLRFSQITTSDMATLGLPTQDYNPFGLLGIDISNPYIDWLSPDVTDRTGIYAPSLYGPTIAYVTSTALAPQMSFDEKGQGSNVLAQIDLGKTPHGQMAYFECLQDVLCEIDYGRPRSLTLADIQLVDHDGYPLDLQGGELNLWLRVWLNDY